MSKLQLKQQRTRSLRYKLFMFCVGNIDPFPQLGHHAIAMFVVVHKSPLHDCVCPLCLDFQEKKKKRSAQLQRPLQNSAMEHDNKEKEKEHTTSSSLSPHSSEEQKKTKFKQKVPRSGSKQPSSGGKQKQGDRSITGTASKGGDSTTARQLIILVDMDNTLSAYNEAAVRRYEEVYKPKKQRYIFDVLQLIIGLKERSNLIYVF